MTSKLGRTIGANRSAGAGSLARKLGLVRREEEWLSILGEGTRHQKPQLVEGSGLLPFKSEIGIFIRSFHKTSIPAGFTKTYKCLGKSSISILF